MPGTLYVIGAGPGDPSLLTLRAVEVLKAVPCVCVPKGREEGSSLALSIVRQAVDLGGKEIVEAYFPMKKTDQPEEELEGKWEEAAEALAGRLEAGADVAFITLGDPTVYSTFFHLHERLVKRGLPVEVVPGVSSITAAASRAGLSLALADDRLAVVPATYGHDLGEVLTRFDTVVLMKVHRVFDRVVRDLEEAGLTDRAVYVARVGMADETVKPIREVRPEDLNYFSMVIVRKQGGGRGG